MRKSLFCAAALLVGVMIGYPNWSEGYGTALTAPGSAAPQTKKRITVPAGTRILFPGMGSVVQVRQQMHKIQNADKSRRQQVHLEQRPVVFLAVADTGFACRAIQAATLHLGGHLPTKRVAVRHGGDDRPHPFLGGRPTALFLPQGLALGFSRASAGGPAPRLHPRRQRGHARRLQKLARRFRLRIGG